MILSFKTECFPNAEQKESIERNFGMRRFFFNKTIMYLKHKYGDLKENKKLITKKEVFELRKTLFREKYKSLTETVPSPVLDCAMEDVMFALNSLWRKGKNITLRKKKFSNTFRFQRKTESTFKYENESKYFSTVKLKNLKLAEPIRWSIDCLNDIKTMTIKKIANRYFISFSINLPDNKPMMRKNTHLGIDWGVSTYITAFDGEDITKLDFDEKILSKLNNRIDKIQRFLSRKKRNSKNFAKVTIKLQQAYLDFNNYRRDIINEIVNAINLQFDSVTLENLTMSFAIKNKRLARKVMSKPYYLLKVSLINKFKQFSKTIYKVSKTFPSTQMCSCCGHIKTGENKMKLGQKVYTCEVCHTVKDRDENAAINIYNHRGLEEFLIEE